MDYPCRRKPWIAPADNTGGAALLTLPRPIIHDLYRMEMSSLDVHLRTAGRADLEAINRIIEAAVMTWNLPERVKRLALPSYRFTALDLEHLETVLAENDRQQTIGVAAWEPADTRDTPAGHAALQLYGLYVAPSYHRQGVGQRLFRAAETAVCQQRFDGLLVKAQEDAIGFFIAQGMHRLPAADPVLHYAHRFWKSRLAILENSGEMPVKLTQQSHA